MLVIAYAELKENHPKMLNWIMNIAALVGIWFLVHSYIEVREKKLEMEFANKRNAERKGKEMLRYHDSAKKYQTHPTPVSYTHLTLPTICSV